MQRCLRGVPRSVGTAVAGRGLSSVEQAYAVSFELETGDIADLSEAVEVGAGGDVAETEGPVATVAGPDSLLFFKITDRGDRRCR